MPFRFIKNRQKSILPVLVHFVTVFRSVQNATLGILIKDVKSGHVVSNGDGVTCTSGGSRGYAGDQLALFANVEVEVDLGTHKLGNVNVCVERCALALRKV